MSLRDEIIALQKQIDEKTRILFLERILKLVSMTDKEFNDSNVKNINIMIDKNTIEITYLCECKNYKTSGYMMPKYFETVNSVIDESSSEEDDEETERTENDKNDDDENEENDKDKNNSDDKPLKQKEITTNLKFKINFGFKKKYYIRGNDPKRFKIYYNSENQLRIINSYYSSELDFKEQSYLIDKYTNNYDKIGRAHV